MEKNRFFGSIAFTIATLLFLASTVFSQPLARFDSPMNGEIGVSLTPTIRIISQYKIDSGGIAFAGHQADSLQKAILVIPKFVYDSIPELKYDTLTSTWFNLWNKFGVRGTYFNPNDTTLEFIPSSLKMDQSYVAIIHNVSVMYPDSSIHQLSDSIITFFFTVLSPHTILATNLLDDNGFVNCKDTIKIHYSRKIDSVNTAGGPLVEFYRSIFNPADTIIDTNGTTPHFLKDTITMTAWVAGSDSTYIYCIPKDTIPGNSYEAAFYTSRLTGDSTQDYAYGFSTREYLTLTVDAKPSNGTDTIRTISQYELQTGTFLVMYGDTINLSPVAIIDTFTFQKWLCPTDASINNSTTVPLVITRTAEHLDDLHITALYKRTPKDTITVYYDSGGTAFVLDKNFSEMSGTSTFVVRRGDSVRLIPKADSLKEFNHWWSSASALNGSTSGVITVKVNGNVSFRPIFDPRSATGFYNFCARVVIVDNPWISAPANLTAPTGGIDGCIPVLDNAPTNHNASVQVIDPNHNWGLRQYKVEKNGSSILVPNPAPTVENLAPLSYVKTVTETSSDPKTQITFFVERLEVNLQIEIALEDDSEPNTDEIFSVNTIPNTKMWVQVSNLVTANHLGVKPIDRDLWTIGTPRDQFMLTYQAGDIVHLEAGIGIPNATIPSGFEFVGWSTESGYISISEISESANKLWLTLNFSTSPIKVKAIFRRKFSLKSITLWQDKNYTSTFSPISYDPDIVGGTYGTLQKEAWTDDEGVKVVKVKMEFSEAVDESTLFKGMTGVEHWDNITWVALGSHKGTYHPGAFFSSILNYELEDDNHTVVWTLLAKHQLAFIAVTKLQLFTITLTDALKSENGDPLSNPRSFTAQSINPDVKWEIEKINVIESNECCDGEAGIYMPTAATYIKDQNISDDCPEGMTLSSSEDQCDQTFTIGDGTDIGGEHYYDAVLINKLRVGDAGGLLASTLVMDRDANWLADLILVIAALTLFFGFGVLVLSIIGVILKTASLTLILSNMSTYFVSWMSYFLTVFQRQGVFNGKDDFYGQTGWLGNRENWWGGAPSYKNSLRQRCDLDDGKVDVYLKVTLH